MPVEIGYIPAGAPIDAHGLDVPAGLPASTTDVLIAAPKTVSIVYAALSVEERYDEVERVVAAHDAGVESAIRELNQHAAVALVYRRERRQTLETRLAEMLEREPDAIPERREELERHAHAELRDPAVVKHIDSTGLRIRQLFHVAHNDDRGDPHLHTHLFLDAEVTAADDGRDYPRDHSILVGSLAPVMRAYDTAMATSLSELVNGCFLVSDATGRREVDGISDEVVGGFPGTVCTPDARFHQVYADRALRPDVVLPIGASSRRL